jgi:hypothetical protein
MDSSELLPCSDMSNNKIPHKLFLIQREYWIKTKMNIANSVGTREYCSSEMFLIYVTEKIS